jgi:arylsulfatase
MSRASLLRVVALPCLAATLIVAAPVPEYRTAKPVWPERVRPPAGTPNVLIILWDDIGFSQFSCYGSPIATPNIDRIAAQGLRYSNFHVAPVCSPTRAALLTGRNPHTVGVACVAEFANGQTNSTGGMRLDAGTVAEYLRGAGYSTYAVGKWHLTPMNELNPGASSDHWPTGRGFDHFYGFTSGETNPWAPELYHDRERIKLPPVNPDGSPKHSEVDLTDHAIAFLAEQRATAPDKPFFLYLAFSAGHAPHQVPAERAARWRGRFDQGWDAVRAEALARQKQLGLVPPGTQLPPRNPGVKAWDELAPDERRLYARYYETFAAFVEYTDEQMGRLLDHLERSGQLDNTLVILASDNGASPEGGPEGMWNEVRLFTTETQDKWTEGLGHLADLGSPLTYATYPTGWTMAGNTPFRLSKGTAHEGGVRVPLIMRWPGHILEAGGIRGQFHDVIDLMPTILESAGVTPPPTLDGRTQLPLPGVSMAYTWPSGAAPSHRTTQYVEIYGSRAIYHDGWKAVVFHPINQPFVNDRWELYDLTKDFNEIHDLAAAEPGKLAELQAVWEREAVANNVYPLDDRRAAREMALPPGSPQQGSRFVFHPPVSGIHKGAAPDLRKRSWSLTAEVHPGAAGTTGVLAAFGGRFAGWSLYLHQGVLKFHYNYGGVERTTVAATGPLPAQGDHRCAVRFTNRKDGGADVVLTIDGREAGRGAVPRVMRNITHETFDLGCDLYTPVTEDYASPAFLPDGALGEVVVEAEPYTP